MYCINLLFFYLRFFRCSEIKKKGGCTLSIQGVFEWFSGEAKWAIFITLIVLLIVTGFKRAWIAMIGVLAGLAVIAMFIVKPDLIITLAEWLTGLLKFGGG